MSQEHSNLIYSLGLRLATMEQITSPKKRVENELAQKICRSIRNDLANLIDQYGEDLYDKEGQKIGRSFGRVIKRPLRKPIGFLMSSIGSGSAKESTQLIIYDTRLLGEENYIVMGTDNCAVFEGQEKVVPGGIKTRNISLREAKALIRRVDKLKVKPQSLKQFR